MTSQKLQEARDFLEKYLPFVPAEEQPAFHVTGGIGCIGGFTKDIIAHDDYGVGVRVKTPFGNLRVDYAKGEDENRTYFGFGEMF